MLPCPESARCWLFYYTVLHAAYLFVPLSCRSLSCFSCRYCLLPGGESFLAGDSGLDSYIERADAGTKACRTSGRRAGNRRAFCLVMVAARRHFYAVRSQVETERNGGICFRCSEITCLEYIVMF